MSSSALSHYINTIKKVPKLTPEQELTATPDELILANLPLVIFIAKTYRMYDKSKESLIERIQDGNVGLIKAANNNNFTKGFKFSTFAGLLIRQEIHKGLDNRKPIKKPKVLIDNYKIVREMIDDNISNVDICKKLGIARLINVRGVVNPHFNDIYENPVLSDKPSMCEQLEVTREFEKLEKMLGKTATNDLLKRSEGWTRKEIGEEDNTDACVKYFKPLYKLKKLGLTFDPRENGNK